MIRKSTYKRNQRGVALLFALGVLSLLLIMGLAFVANSLLAQKIASNNSSRSQAKMLAQSAISRMAISLMYYQYSLYQNSSGAAPENYMDVCSRFDLTKNADIAAIDGLRYEDSKLIPGTWLTSYDLASDLRGEWSYITAKVEASDDEGKIEGEDADGNVVKLVGRVAYQLIPSTTTAQINLEHSLGGIYEQGTPIRKPWATRLGADINELNLDQTDVFKGWMSINGIAPGTLEELDASTYQAFFDACKDTLFAGSGEVKEEKQAWVKHWFTDGVVAADPEYYCYNVGTGTGKSEATYLHRFNLGELDDEAGTITDEWYDRLGGVAKNSEDAVEELAGNSVEFKITDKWTPEGVGLPFLKFIGSSPGTFNNIADRRRQIAANLNDYCDSDSIPTSDVSAELWKENLNTSDISTGWPKYTGNEKTPYINEFAFGFNINPTVENTTSATGMKIKADVNADLAAELISIYEETPSDPYTLYVNLPASGFTFNLEVKAKIKITYKATETSKEEETTVTAEKTFPIKLATGTEESPVSDIREIVFATGLWKSGYAVNHLNLSLSDSTVELSGDENGVISDVVTGKYSSSVELTHVSFAVKPFDFKVQGMTLTKQESVGAATKEVGVDFVRWDKSYTSPEISLFQNVKGYQASGENAGFIDINAGGTGTFAVDVKDQKIYLAGMQARDPRQNLNVKENLKGDGYDEDASDWRTFSDIAWVEYDSDKTSSTPDPDPDANPYDDGVLSMKVKFAATSLDSSWGDGLVNKDVSNPSGRETELNEASVEVVVGDYETVEDPAWQTDADTSTDSHLSTAYIRNAPMKSLWELGVIHRAKAWQTINLKNAMRPGTDDQPIRNSDMKQPGEGDTSWDGDGTSFVGGDGGLLEQVKITDKAYCYGKLNVNMLSNNTTLNPDYTEKDDEMGRALFYNIRRGQAIGDLFVGDTESYPETGTQITWDNTSTVVDPMKTAVDEFRLEYGTDDYGNAFENRAQFLAWEDGDGNSLANGFGIIPHDEPNNEYAKLPDAQREELVGKTINLIKGNNSVSNMIRFIVVAQTIRDMDGVVARIKYNGDVELSNTGESYGKKCKYGTFDVMKDDSVPADFPENDKYLYFDEITGEVKLLVTMENNPSTGQIIVRQIEYID